MKIFQTIQKNLALIGFVPNQQQNTHRTVSKIQAFGIGSAAFFTCLICINFIFVAKSTEEYMYSVFALIGATGMTTTHISLVVKNDKIFKAVNLCETLLNDSKFKIKYQQKK